MKLFIFLGFVGILGSFAAAVGATPCDPKCSTSQGWCQSGGRCLCWWGWTGPNAVYITTGALKNRILADFCLTACHYTLDYRNSKCARIPVPPVCSVPPTPITPPVPCDSQCNAGVYHGQCLSSGRCLCWWGWTGTNSCYVSGNKTFTNRILANNCNVPCHYTQDYRNTSCVTNFTELPTKVPGTTQLPTQRPTTERLLTTATPCNPNCTVRGHGACQSDGRCLCWWGWTGPNAVYILTGALKNRILADYCFTACHYTLDYLNPYCARIPVPPVCSVPPTPISPRLPCDMQCNAGVFHGQCLSNGRCLCWWGWTGPNSCYVSGNKTFTNRILADHCNVPCHYTHDYRNASCVTNFTRLPTKVPGTTHLPTQLLTTERLLTTATPCNPNCTVRGHGSCQSDGRCLCWWGWTGPNAVYILTGALKNRILADYCFTACHYTHDYLNPSCARIPVPPVCSIPPTPISPRRPCDPQCNAGVYHGQCLSTGRCLCWWGWTGPNSCYVSGNKTFTNRILADSCNVACHYTHHYRNPSCVTNYTVSPTDVSGTTATTQGPSILPATDLPATGPSSKAPTGSTRGPLITTAPITAIPTTVEPTEPLEPTELLEPTEPPEPDEPMALGAKFALKSKEEQPQEGKLSDTGKGADSPSTGSGLGVTASLGAILCVVAIMAVVLLAYRRQRRHNRVGQQPVIYSSSDETEPLLIPFHYSSHT